MKSRQIDLVRELYEVDIWSTRRVLRIPKPDADLIRISRDGVPFCAQEFVLLFKRRTSRSKVESDFAELAPGMSPDSWPWLIDALALVHPGHRWLTMTQNDQP